MRLPPLEVRAPGSVEEATALLDELGEDAAVYCGGTELLLVAKLGLSSFRVLVDIKGIDELSGLTANGSLRIGATTTHRQIERSDLVRERWPSLAAMERDVGNLRVRNVGTIGGNLCFADPHSDPATYLLAAGASLRVRRGSMPPREVAIEQFIRGPYQTALEPDELLLCVDVPPPPSGSAIVHRKLSFHERPAVTVAVNLTVGDGMLTDARLAVGSVGVAARRLAGAERILPGIEASAPSDDQLAECCEAAAAEAEPVADGNGSVQYKRQLVRVLTDRCVRDALGRAVAASSGRASCR